MNTRCFKWPLALLLLSALLLCYSYFYHSEEMRFSMSAILAATQRHLKRKQQPEVEKFFSKSVWCSKGNMQRFSPYLDTSMITESPIFKQLPKDLSAYGSHLVPLTAAVLSTKGPILELGAGLFSTKTLDLVSNDQNRTLLTAESDNAWLQKVLKSTPSTGKHSFHHVTNDNGGWQGVGEGQFWSVVFVDQAPAERRQHDMMRLNCSAELVVVHDTESSYYHYDFALTKFGHKLSYEKISPYTMILSNFFDLRPLAELLDARIVS